MLIVPDVGEAQILDWALRLAGENQLLKLYTAGTLAEGMTKADLTEVGGGIGYSPLPLTRASWDPADTTDGVTSIAYAEQVFEITGAVTIVGYYITSAVGDEEILWIEQLASAISLLSGGGDITITPQIQLD